MWVRRFVASLLVLALLFAPSREETVTCWSLAFNVRTAPDRYAPTSQRCGSAQNCLQKALRQARMPASAFRSDRNGLAAVCNKSRCPADQTATADLLVSVKRPHRVIISPEHFGDRASSTDKDAPKSSPFDVLGRRNTEPCSYGGELAARPPPKRFQVPIKSTTGPR